MLVLITYDLKLCLTYRLNRIGQIEVQKLVSIPKFLIFTKPNQLLSIRVYFYPAWIWELTIEYNKFRKNLSCLLIMYIIIYLISTYFKINIYECYWFSNTDSYDIIRNHRDQ